MQKKPKTDYPIEREAERLLNEMATTLRALTKFFFKIPKRKDDKMIYVMETIAWITLTLALIWRIRG